jgi:hypothetical protein
MRSAVRRAQAGFRRIEAPKELRAEYATYLRDLDRFQPLLGQLQQSVSDSNVLQARTLEKRIERLSAQAEPLSRRLGLKACGGGGG